MANEEYIERNSLLKEVKQIEGVFAAPLIIRKIEEAKTVDVVEVKHGYWIEHFSFGCWHYDCSVCNEGFATSERDMFLPAYCQDCGSKMDLKEGDLNDN